MNTKKVLKICTTFVGCFFVLSGFAKAIDTTAFSNLIAGYGFPFMSFTAPFMVVVEIALGIALVLELNPRRDSLIALLFLVSFTSAFAFAHFHNGVNDCGCFGKLRPSSWGPTESFIQNAVLITLCLIIRLKYPKDEVRRPLVMWKKGLIFSLILAGMFISGLTFSMPEALHDLTHKNKFKNQNIKNTELANYVKTAPGKTYMIFCFSYTCTHCWNSFANVQGFKKSGTVDSVIALAVGDDSSKIFFNQNFQPDFNIRTLSEDAFDKISTSYPVGFYVKNDTIKYVIDGEIPSSMTFRKANNIAFNPPKSATAETSCTPTSCGH
jgi:uncharacterized membrane protein YphA (DoxX/SURF4 family)